MLGMEAASLMWLFAPLYLSGIFLSRKMTLTFFIIVSSLLVAVGFLLSFELLPWSVPLYAWIVIACSYVAIAFFLIYSARFIINRLARALRKERELNRRLSRAADENEHLFREIHHRVNNNLQLMLSLLYLEHNSDSPVREGETLTRAENRFSALALSYSFLDRMDGSLRVRFDDLLASMIGNMNDSETCRSRFLWNGPGEAVYLSLETAVPLSLLVSEFLSESLVFLPDKEVPGDEYAGVVDLLNDDMMLNIRIAGKAVSRVADEGRRQAPVPSTIIISLAEQVQATFSWCDTPGNSVIISMRK